MFHLHKQTIATLLLLAGALAWPLFISRDSDYLVLPGVDKFSAHWPIKAGRNVSQTFISPHPTLTSVGVVLVPFKGAGHGDITLSILDSDNNQIAKSTIPAASIMDDAVETFRFPIIKNIRNQALTIKLSSNSDQANVAVRINPDQNTLLSGTGLRNNQSAPGDLALTLTRRTNLYGYLYDQIKSQPTLTRSLRLSLLTGAAVSLIYLWVAGSSARLTLAVILLVVVILPWRLTLVDEMRGVSGGDAYNFLFIMQRISNSGQFYHADQKRLPVWPLLLLPAKQLTSDIIFSARVINQFIVAATIVLLAVLARQLRLPPGAVLLSLLLLSFNRDFLYVGYRPLAYPLAGLLILAGLVLLFHGKSRPKFVILAGLVFGLAGQTRQEALLIGLVIIGLTCLVWLLEKKWRPAAAMIIPWLIIIAPYFIANTYMFGNPFYTSYLDHPVTNPRLSAGEIRENLGHSWAYLSSTWWESWRQQMRIELIGLAKKVAVATVLLGVIWPAAARFWPPLRKIGFIIAPAIIFYAALVFIAGYIISPFNMRTQVTIGLVFISIYGLIVTLHRLAKSIHHKTSASRVDSTFGRTILVLLTAAGLYAIASWVHPVAKTYYSFLPYLALAAGLGIHYLINTFHHLQINMTIKKHDAVSLVITYASLSIIFALTSLPLIVTAQTLTQTMDFASKKSTLDYLTYQAARQVTNKTGQVAMRQDLLPALYFLPNRIVRFPETTNSPPPDELNQAGVKWIMWFSDDKLFDSYAKQPDKYSTYFSAWAFNRSDEKVEVRLLQLP